MSDTVVSTDRHLPVGDGIGRQVLMHAYPKAMSAEPDITYFLKQIAAENGASLVGLASRLKPEAAIIRKVRDEIVPDLDNPTHINAADHVRDMVRYTIVAPDDRYAPVAQSVITFLRKATDGSGVVKNFWDKPSKPGYHGINTFWVLPNGVRFEVQLHTRDSIGTRERMQQDHDQYVDLSQPPRDREIAMYRMVDKASKLPHYPGAASVKVGSREDFTTLDMSPLPERFWAHQFGPDEPPRAVCHLDSSTAPPSYWVVRPASGWTQNDALGSKIQFFGADDWAEYPSKEALKLISRWRQSGR